MKRILITGKNSYIGNSFKEWVSQWPEKYQVDEVSTRDNIWKERSFAGYDSILHVAGIAHIKETKENRDLYYQINRDLAVDIAKKAKKEGVKQFVFLSSMSVYGLTTGVIDQHTPLNPKNAYGKSKLEAEQIISEMQDDSFLVAIVRPPMVYGKGSKGNYRALSKLAKITPIFPDINNQRSMIYIDHLSEFIKNLMKQNIAGLFFPQNKDYVSTTEMVREIANYYDKNIFMTRLFNPVINRIMKRVDFIKKIYGTLVYTEKISKVEFNYQIYDFIKTIQLTEKR